MPAPRVSLLALSSALLLACGDDGGGSGDDSTDTSATGAGTTAADSADPATSSPDSADDDGDDGGTSTSGAVTGDGSTGDGTGAGSGTTGDEAGSGGSDSGAVGCLELADQMACERDETCLWLGNANNGVCVGADAGACETLDMQQVCNMHPECAWDPMAGTCGPA